MVRDLQRSGLSEKAALVYATILEMGGAYPSRISEATHLNRSTVYKVLIDLSVKGLVTEIEKGKKLFYQVERPQQLLRFAKMRRDTADEEYERVKTIIPEIEGMYSMSPNKPRIRFFENREGIMSILEDHINVKTPYEMVGFANTDGLEKFIPPTFFKNYIQRKNCIGITTRGILSDGMQARTFNSRMYSVTKKSVIPNLRFIPADQFPINGEIIMYAGNKISFFNFDEKGGLVGIIVEDKAIHDMMVRIFELAWKGAGAK